jgi:hypothetical protein
MYLYKVMMFAASLLYNIFDVRNAKIDVKRGDRTCHAASVIDLSILDWHLCRMAITGVAGATP